MKRKEIVVKYLQMSEAEKSAFWPVYDSYYNAIQYLEMEYIQLLTDYAKQHNDVAEEKMAQYAYRILQNDLALARVRKQYFKKFTRVVSPLLASEFMQLDNSLRSMLRMDIQRDMPLAHFTQTALYSRKDF